MQPHISYRYRWTLSASSILTGLTLCTTPVRAQNPSTIPFQGKAVTTSGAPLSGLFITTFRLYNNTEGTFVVSNEPHTVSGNAFALNFQPLVTNSETIVKADGTVTYTRGTAYTVNYTTGVVTRVSSAALPDGTQLKVSYHYTAAKLWEETKLVSFTAGLFTTALGNNTAFPASLAFDQPLYLSVQVSPDPEMTPRLPLAAVPFALSIPDGSVTNRKLALDPVSLDLVSGGAMTSDGTRIGIGTASPARQLEIEAPQAIARLTSDTSANGSVLELGSVAASPTILGAVNFLNPGGATSGQIAFRADGAAAVTANSTERLRIDPSGRIGIGTASPTREVEVQNAGDVELGLKSKDANGRLWTLQSSSAPATGGTNGSFQVIDRTAGASRMLIDAGGNVGIGTTTPDVKLDVNGSIRANGTVAKTFGSSAFFNISPIAMAWIDSNGTVRTGTPNLTCSFDSSSKTYTVAIAGESYQANGVYITQVTAEGAGTGTVSIPAVGSATSASGAGVWIVSIVDGFGSAKAKPFSFVVYKP